MAFKPAYAAAAPRLRLGARPAPPRAMHLQRKRNATGRDARGAAGIPSFQYEKKRHGLRVYAQ